MKRFVKIAFLCALYFLCSCENQFNYETSETALLVGEWVCIDSDDMVDIVFTKKEVQELSGVSVNVVSNVIKQLVELKIIVPDSSIVKKGYRYQKIYDVFVGSKNFV